MPFVDELATVLCFALIGVILLLCAGACFKAKSSELAGTIYSILGIVFITVSLVGSYVRLGAGNPASLVNGGKLMLNTGTVYCTEWSGERNGTHESLIRNVAENRRYFVKSEKNELPAGCFLKMDNGKLMNVPQSLVEPQTTAPPAQ